MNIKVRVWWKTNKKTNISVIVVYAMVRYAMMHELEICNDTRVRERVRPKVQRCVLRLRHAFGCTFYLPS